MVGGRVGVACGCGLLGAMGSSENVYSEDKKVCTVITRSFTVCENTDTAHDNVIMYVCAFVYVFVCARAMFCIFLCVLFISW